MKNHICENPLCKNEFTPKDPRHSRFCSRSCVNMSRLSVEDRNKRTRSCETCGKTFLVYESKPDKKYCSTACYSASKRTIVSCRTCGKEISAFSTRKGRKKYCSKECKSLDESSTKATINPEQDATCVICGKPFRRCDQKSKGRTRNTKTCSRECAIQSRGLGGKAQKGLSDVKNTCMHCGVTFITLASRQKKYCSKQCQVDGRKGVRRNSKEVICDNCQKPFFLPVSRLTGRNFCSNKCYHDWDKRYKSTPKMVERMAQRIRDNELGGISKLEDRVSSWLSNHGVSHERQVRLGHYVIDFKIGNIYLEINGCYWHGCPVHYSEPTKHQIKRQGRDRSLAAYTKACGKTLYFLMIKGNFPLVILSR